MKKLDQFATSSSRHCMLQAFANWCCCLQVETYYTTTVCRFEKSFRIIRLIRTASDNPGFTVSGMYSNKIDKYRNLPLL